MEQVVFQVSTLEAMLELVETVTTMAPTVLL
jgi:hypothetical protein